jgi:hypothetical protein
MATLRKSYFNLRVQTNHTFVILITHSWRFERIIFRYLKRIFFLIFNWFCLISLWIAFYAIGVPSSLEFQLRCVQNIFLLLKLWFFEIILIRMEQHHRNNFFYILHKIIKLCYINLLLDNSFVRSSQVMRYSIDYTLFSHDFLCFCLSSWRWDTSHAFVALADVWFQSFYHGFV